MVIDSLNKHSASIDDLEKDAKGTGKTFIYNICHEYKGGLEKTALHRFIRGLV